MVVGLLLGCAVPPPPAHAAWTSTKAVTAGAFTMAKPAHQFSGPAPATYSMAFTVISFVDTHYPVLSNTGAAAAFTGMVSPASVLPLGSTVMVRSCPVAWTLGTCPAGVTTLLAPTSLTTPVAVTYQSSPIAAGASAYLQLKVGGLLFTAAVTLNVTRAVLPAGGTNRTHG